MILIAIGANLPVSEGGQPIETCRDAVSAIAGLPGLHLVAVSGWWQSAPMPPSDQPPYINGVAAFDGHIDPALLLKQLQAIETAFGRVRTGINSARTLDLDIIAMGSLIRESPDPVLPHPRAHLRAFVLEPLHEILPAWRHPLSQQTALQLLAELPRQVCERVPPDAIKTASPASE